MRKIALATAAILIGATSAHAQNWTYQSGPNGTPPFAYGDPYGNLYSQPNLETYPPRSYSTPSFAPLPRVPGISRYAPFSGRDD